MPYLCSGSTWVHVVTENDFALRFARFVVLYLCFGVTCVHVVTKNDLLLWLSTWVLAVPRYMLRPKRIYLS